MCTLYTYHTFEFTVAFARGIYVYIITNAFFQFPLLRHNFIYHVNRSLLGKSLCVIGTCRITCNSTKTFLKQNFIFFLPCSTKVSNNSLPTSLLLYYLHLNTHTYILNIIWYVCKPMLCIHWLPPQPCETLACETTVNLWCIYFFAPLTISLLSTQPFLLHYIFFLFTADLLIYLLVRARALIIIFVRACSYTHTHWIMYTNR